MAACYPMLPVLDSTHQAHNEGFVLKSVALAQY